MIKRIGPITKISIPISRNEYPSGICNSRYLSPVILAKMNNSAPAMTVIIKLSIRCTPSAAAIAAREASITNGGAITSGLYLVTTTHKTAMRKKY